MATPTSVPKLFKNFSVTLDGLRYPGLLKKFSPPSISVKTESYRNGGMDVERSVDMGLEKLTAKATFSEYIPAVLSAVADGDSEGHRLIARGALQRNNETATPVVVEMQGMITKSSFGDWEAGKSSDFDADLDLIFYSLTIGGTEIYYIDVDNAIRRINGVDVMATIRDAMGV